MSADEASGLALLRRPGRGESIMWLHGYTLDATVWTQVWELLPEFNHVGVDLPGHGRSRSLTLEDDLPALGSAIAQLARDEGVRHVVAMSFGGLIGMEAAIALGHDLDTLTLAGAPLGGGPQDPEATACNADLTRLLRARGVGPWLVERWMSTPPQIFAGAARNPPLFRALAEIVGRHRWRELTDGTMARLMARVHRTADLASIRARTLLLNGATEMEAFRRSTELLRRGIAGASRRSLDDAGHLCLLEQPGLAALAIGAHIRYSGETALDCGASTLPNQNR
jgi:pimeloyl-ACP methyl ester carboxylesterase